jgi:hypothetical protein
MIAKSSHRACWFAGLALAAISVSVFGWLGWRDIRRPRGPAGPVALADAPYTPAIAETVARPSEGWAPPPAQSRGREWVYDTFTPPQIFFNARSRQFTVKPPAGFIEEEPDEAFGVELVAVRPEPFRLQLMGFIGDEGNWRGTFENLRSGEVFLASAGRRVPNLALYIKSLDVRSQPVATRETMTTRQRVATAVIHDEKTGRDVTLTHRERHFTSTLSALLAAPGETTTREARVGDAFKLGPATYRIDRIGLTPPSVEITKEAPTLTQPDRRTLTPREPGAVEPVGGNS